MTLVVIACNAEKAEKIYGTWVNMGGSGDYKFVFNPDGTGTYINRDGSIKDESRFTIDQKWVDSEGNTWYTIKAKWHTAPFREEGAIVWYSLHKIDPTGKTREVDNSMKDYPKEFYGPVGMGGHQIFQRQ